VIAGPGVETVAELAGKKVGVEIGFVGHLLLLDALEQHGLTESDVELVNVPTNETPQVLASGQVDAIVAWQPSSGMALQLVPGSKSIHTSADQPGLIYDVLAVNPASLAGRRDDWAKVVQVWYRVVDYFYDPETRDDAIAIMASRVGLPADRYAAFVDGTRILTLAEAKGFFEKADGFGSLYGSSKTADDFNVGNQVYAEPQDVDSYIDASLTTAL
jgi:NitT/TauT family transport system substrate-binding protein